MSEFWQKPELTPELIEEGKRVANEEQICAECGDDLPAEGHLCCTECMERAVICPECRAGKYPNCTHEAMDDDDLLVPCEGWKVAPA